MGRCKHINGDIWIQTDKPAYYAGELVEGTVFLTVREPIQCHGVQVKASGKEKVEWTEQRSRQVRDGEDDQGNPRFRTEHYEVEFDEKEKFFKDWIDVWRAPGATIPAGQWSYRWQYQLPAGLPGSIDYHSHNEGWLVKSKAYIKYKFKATLDAAWKKDLKEEQEIIVYQQQQQAVQAQADSKIENIYCCCCFPKGKAGLSVVMDKNTYMPGDTAQILADIDMSESKAELSKMNVSLIRTIELKADGHFKQLQHCVSKVSHLKEGIKPGDKKDQVPLPLSLPHGEVFPSTQGRYLKCRYHVDVECDIAWASDVNLYLDVAVVPNLPVIWQPTGDMNFAPQV